MKRRTVVMLTVVLMVLAGLVFSIPAFSQPPTPPGVERLRQDAVGEVEITWNPHTGTPSFIRGRIPLSAMGLKSQATPATVAFGVVDHYADLFGIKQAAHELNMVKTHVDTLGMRHATLGQVHQGIEVYGAYMKVHLSADGQEVVAISSGFVPDIRLPDTEPHISADQALTTAQKALPNGILLSGPKLVVYPGPGNAPGASAKLAWLVEMRDDAIPARNRYVVDATDGSILDVLDRLYYEQSREGGSRTTAGTQEQAASRWNEISQAPRGIGAGASLIYHQNTLYISAGAGTSDFWQLDLDSGSWHTLASFPEDIGHGADMAFDGERYIYATKGTSLAGLVGSQKFWRYDIAENRWEELPDIPEAVGVVGSIVFADGGVFARPGGHFSDGFYRYDPSSRAWETLATGPRVLVSSGPAAAMAYDGTRHIYTFQGGENIGGIELFDELWRYDTQSNEWSELGFREQLDRADLTYVAGALYALSEHSMANFEVFDLSNNEWIPREDLPCGIGIWTSVGPGASLEYDGGQFIYALEGGLQTAIWRYLLEGRVRQTYVAYHRYSLPGTLVRSDGDPPTGDEDVDNAHDFAGATYDYYLNTHQRDSYDDQGATLISTANYGYSYMNAFWNGEQTVYGDGFPVKDVVAHEWTHAVTEHSANLEYRWQSGALNESFSDIFGAMVDRDDWLIGEDLPPDVLGGRMAIRSLWYPPMFGQPERTADWVETCSDNEGVHTNSGITNKAYFNIARPSAIGKDKAERIFYRALTVYLQQTSSLEDARAAALQSAEDLYGNNSAEYNAVRDGFNAVGLDGQWNPPPNDCCGASVALGGEPDEQSLLSNLRAVRDQVFTQDPGRRWVRIYYEHQFEVAWLLISDSQLRADALAGFRAFDPVFRAGLDDDHAGPPVILTPELIEAARRALMGVAERGSPAVHDDIVREWEKVDPYRFVGWDVREVWEQLRLEERSERIYLPIVLK